MGDEWTPQLTSLLDVARDDLPALWDAGFMLGSIETDGTGSYSQGSDRAPCRQGDLVTR
jgi:hypothetical protein